MLLLTNYTTVTKVNIPLYWWLPTQAEYVAGCYEYYAVNSIVVGDPTEGTWENAHYPVPSCRGGTHTVPLLKQHHAIHNVIQSEELQYPCVYGWEKEYLPAEYLTLLTKWRDVASHLGGDRTRELCGKKICITYSNGTVVTAQSQQHACDILNTTYGKLKRLLYGTKRKHNVAFEHAPAPTYWNDSNPSKPKPVLIHYPDGTIDYAESIKHAVRLTNVNQSTIQHRLKRTVDEQLNSIRLIRDELNNTYVESISII